MGHLSNHVNATSRINVHATPRTGVLNITRGEFGIGGPFDLTALAPCAASAWTGLPVFGEVRLRQILSAYAAYYNQVRTHSALGKDAPLRRAVQRSGVIVGIPILSGLHHHYIRI